MWRKDIEDTVQSTYVSGKAFDLYLMGYEKPHYPLPIRRNRDIDSRYWYWFQITTILFWIKNTQ